MFIRVDRTGADGKGRSSVYECDRYFVEPSGRADSENGTEWIVTMELDRGSRDSRFAYQSSEKGLGVYVMNDRGKTIDTIFRSGE